jgi:hypothetical protein
MTVSRNMGLGLLALGLLLQGAPAVAAIPEAAQVQQQSPQFFLPTAKKQKAPRVQVQPGGECLTPCPDKEQLRLAAWAGERKLASEAPGLVVHQEGKAKAGPKASKAARAEATRLQGRWRGALRPLGKDWTGAAADLTRAGAFAETGLDQWKTATLAPRPLGAGPVWDLADLAGQPVDGVWSALLEVRKGDLVDLQVKRAEGVNGSPTADPLALAFEVLASGEPERLQLLARADDQGDNPLPRLRFQAPRNLKLRLVVAAQRPGASGRGELVLLLGGKKVLEASNAIFGGARVADLTVGEGDRLLVSAGTTGGATAAADSVLLLLADEGVAGTPALLSNNATGLNAELLVPEGFEPTGAWRSLSDRVRCLGEQLASGPAWGEACQNRVLGCFTCFPQEGRATVLLASFGATPLENPLLVHSRVGTEDEDGDGLDQVVERILGTCDGPACMPKGLPKKAWRGADSDLDGILDLDELFGVRRCFPRRPLAPDFDPGPCLDRDSDNFCDRDCQAEDFSVQQVLGAALEANPMVFDIFVEADGWAVADQGEKAKVYLPHQQRLDEMARLFAALKGPLPMRLHWFNDGRIPIHNLAAVPHLPSGHHRHGWFNLLFTPERRYTGTFRHVLGVKGSGGQSDVGGRSSTIGMDGGENLVFRLVHELGHSLGLSHNNDRSAPDRNPLYTSIMNYGFVYSLPPEGQLEGNPTRCAGAGEACGAGLRCLPVDGERYCLPPCGDLRSVLETGRQVFSSGQPAVPGLAADEAAGISERGWAKDFLPWRFCFIDEGKSKGPAVGLRRFLHEDCKSGRCVGCQKSGRCNLDWNQDGELGETGPLDLDGDGKANAKRLRNGDDLTRVFQLGARGLQVSGYQKAALFFTGFEDGPQGPMPLGPSVKDASAGVWLDPTNGCDEKGRWSRCKKRKAEGALLFRGPASGDGPVEYDFCAQDPGNCREAWLAPEGFAFSLRIKVLSPSWGGEGASVLTVGGYIVRVEVDEAGDGLLWTVKDPRGRKKTLKQPAGFGLWQRITLQVDQPNRTWSLGVFYRDRLHSLEGKAPKTIPELSRFSVGGEPGSTSKLTGLVDDVILLRGTMKGF